MISEPRLNAVKKLVKLLLTVTAVFTGFAAAGFYLYLKTLPTRPPEFARVEELDNRQPATAHRCTLQQPFQYAYAVNVNIESQLNDKLIYESRLDFKTQLSQANGDLIKGVATDIKIDEGSGNKTLEDVYFLSRIEAEAHTVFTAFNNLGLAEKHPMSVVAQLLKALSVGKEGETYRFSYDSMQRNYHYRDNAGNMERVFHPSSAAMQQLPQTLEQHKSNWRVELDQSCVPASVYSEELQTISAAGHSGYIRFQIEARKIPGYIDIGGLAFTSRVNAANRWDAKGIHAAEFENPVTSQEEMWGIFNEFATDKNTARLIKAAEYMIDNLSALELSGILMGDDISDTAKRDLIFALGITGRDDAEAYMLDALTTLPVDSGNAGDLQKVRLMVAVSANGKVTENAYDALSGMASNPTASDNIRSNALINMGTIVRQLEGKGQSTEAMQRSLSALVAGELQSSPNAASAILAAGNANLDGMEQAILAKLTSQNAKERYASGMVLSRDPVHYDALIQHLRTERSNLVTNAIVKNLKPESLSHEQKAALEAIAATADTDKANLISNLLK